MVRKNFISVTEVEDGHSVHCQNMQLLFLLYSSFTRHLEDPVSEKKKFVSEHFITQYLLTVIFWIPLENYSSLEGDQNVKIILLLDFQIKTLSNIMVTTIRMHFPLIVTHIPLNNIFLRYFPLVFFANGYSYC